MTPEQERKHREALRELEEWAREPEPSLITLTTIYRGQKTVANALLFHVEEYRTWRAQFVRRYDSLRERFEDLRRRYNAGRGMRERMPTLNPDDSGSIELKAFGQEAAFRGTQPVRLFMVLLAISLIGASGYFLHAATSHASSPSAPVAGERK